MIDHHQRVHPVPGHRRSGGMTLLGYIFVLLLLLAVAYLSMKLVPHYINYYSVRTSMESVAAESRTGEVTMGQLRNSLMQKLNINYISSIRPQDVTFNRGGRGNSMRVAYRVCEDIVANIEACMNFSHTVVLGPQTR